MFRSFHWYERYMYRIVVDVLLELQFCLAAYLDRKTCPIKNLKQLLALCSLPMLYYQRSVGTPNNGPKLDCNNKKFVLIIS